VTRAVVNVLLAPDAPETWRTVAAGRRGKDESFNGIMNYNFILSLYIYVGYVHERVVVFHLCAPSFIVKGISIPTEEKFSRGRARIRRHMANRVHKSTVPALT